MINWLSQGWLRLPRDKIVDSFYQCGVGEKEPLMYHSILRDIIMQKTLPDIGEEIVEDDIIENDGCVEKEHLFTDSIINFVGSSMVICLKYLIWDVKFVLYLN